MEALAHLISAVAELLWPIFAFTALITFKGPLSALLARIRRAKVFDQEIELDAQLDRLQKSAEASAKDTPALPQSDAEATASVDGGTDQIAVILNDATRSPKAALLLLATEIERETRQILASVGKAQGQRYIPLGQALDILAKQFGGLPGHIATSLEFFWKARTEIVHGGQADDDEILRAIDSGITILKALRAIPREINVVSHPGVPVYQDPMCRVLWPNVKGVILENESPGGTTKTYRIFPTTKEHYAIGKRVAWEWNHEKSWGDAWYRDPATDEIKPAWNSAMEFIGRHLEDV